MIGLLVLSGALEGMGMLTLVPLLQVAVGGGHAPNSVFYKVTENVLGVLGLKPALGPLVALAVGAVVTKSAVLWLAMKQVGYTVAHVSTDLRLTFTRALLAARWRHFGSQPIGRFANAVVQETNQAANGYSQACQMLAATVQVMMYISVSLLMSWMTTVFALGVGAIMVVFLRRLVHMSRTAGKKHTQLSKALASRFVDALQGIKAIKAMAQEEQFLHIFEQQTQGLNQTQQRRVLAAESLKAIQEPLGALVLGTGLYAVLSLGTVPFSVVLVMTFVFHRLITRISSIQFTYQAMVHFESAFWSLREEIDDAIAEREPTGGDRVPTLDRNLKIDDVHFAYGERPILRGLSLTVPAGRFVALIGASGAGKTTTVDLILGLHRPQKGEVYIDGVPLSEINLREWRQEVGYVPQEMLLFNDTILNNITLGDKEISRADVERALRDAGAWDFVVDRPDGLETKIGNMGSMVSGGQRQRLAIARALARNPKLLVLDEVTAALDPATEAAICETLQALRNRVTIIAISHQQAIQDAADIAYHVEHGVINDVELAASPARRN